MPAVALAADREHAKLSASSAHRWLACPRSVAFEAQFPEAGSKWTEEGRAAHELGEIKLRQYLGELTKAQYQKRHRQLRTSEHYTDEMEAYTDDYAEHVKGLLKELDAQGHTPTLCIEQRLDYSRWVPEGFGTGDAVIVYEGGIHVVDLKYGKGNFVEVTANPQFRLYALGAYDTLGPLYADISSITLTVFQPRLNNIASEVLAVTELLDWAEQEVKPKAQLAFAGQGDFVPGAAQCRYCRARTVCRARAEQNLELAKYELVPPDTLELAEIGDILIQADELEAWVKDVRKYALEEALSGKTIPRWKVVEGRSNRCYKSQEELLERLTRAGIPAEALVDTKLKGITALEKQVGKKKLEELAGDLIIKPAGAPTLAPETDKRPALDRTAEARNEFQEDIA